VNTRYLDNFSTNLGTSPKVREERIPLLMHYLDKARRNPAIRDREVLEERKLRQQAADLRSSPFGRRD
jgi:hypothetical protein